MERLPEDKYLSYNPDTLQAIRSLYNLEKPGQMDEAIDLLNDWVQKQPHFRRKEFPRDYLERLIILLKGSVERAKFQIDKICTLRTLIPNYFDKYDAKKDLQYMQGFITFTLLPKLTAEHSRIYMMRYEPNKPNKPNLIFHLYLGCVLICEYLKAHDYSNSLISILDLRDVNIMDFLTHQVNLTELRQFMTISLEGYDCRSKYIFFISTSKTIDVLIKLFLQVVSEKIGKRVHVLKKVEELYDYVDRKLLPSDYGGEEKSLVALNNDMIEVFGSEENIKYFKEMSMSNTDESLRTTSKCPEFFLDLAGTFRSLNVD